MNGDLITLMGLLPPGNSVSCPCLAEKIWKFFGKEVIVQPMRISARVQYNARISQPFRSANIKEVELTDKA